MTCVTCWLAKGLGAWDARDEGVGVVVEGCWKWAWWVGGGEYMKSI